MRNENLQVKPAEYVVPADAANWQKRALVVGVIGAVVCVVGAVTSLEQFLRGYLIAYMFWTGLSLGCLALLMLQYLSGGLWGLVIRRVLEAASKCLPLMFVLFLPLLIWRNSLYEWMSNPALTQRNSWYLNTPGWIGRWIVYFAIWISLTLILTRRGDKQDSPGAQPRFQGLSRRSYRPCKAYKPAKMPT